MKTITTKGGQIFERWESRKEALHDVVDIIDGIRFSLELIESNNPYIHSVDDFLWIRYKDGTHYCIGEEGEEGKFKKTNIEAIIDENPCTTMLFGNVDIYNINNVDEKYSKENDGEFKLWNVTITEKPKELPSRKALKKLEKQKVEKKLFKIAMKRCYSIKFRGDLELRYNDSEDFIELSVNEIKDIMKQAYELGKSENRRIKGE